MADDPVRRPSTPLGGVVSDSRQPTVGWGPWFSETAIRASESGRVSVCARLVPSEGGLRVAGVRVALGVCDRCPTVEHTDFPAVIRGVDMVCQAVRS